MSNIVFVVEAFSWQYVKTWRHVTASEKDVRSALRIIDESLNPLDVNAAELCDYVAGIGELAMRVELADQFAVMRTLLRKVAHIVAQREDSKFEVMSTTVEADGELIDRVIYHDQFIR